MLHRFRPLSQWISPLWVVALTCLVPTAMDTASGTTRIASEGAAQVDLFDHVRTERRSAIDIEG